MTENFLVMTVGKLFKGIEMNSKDVLHYLFTFFCRYDKAICQLTWMKIPILVQFNFESFSCLFTRSVINFVIDILSPAKTWIEKWGIWKDLCSVWTLNAVIYRMRPTPACMSLGCKWWLRTLLMRDSIDSKFMYHK